MKCERTTVHFLLPARERRSALLSETPLTTSAFNFPLPYFVELESPTRRKVDSPVSVVGEPDPPQSAKCLYINFGAINLRDVRSQNSAGMARLHECVSYG